MRVTIALKLACFAVILLAELRGHAAVEPVMLTRKSQGVGEEDVRSGKERPYLELHEHTTASLEEMEIEREKSRSEVPMEMDKARETGHFKKIEGSDNEWIITNKKARFGRTMGKQGTPKDHSSASVDEQNEIARSSQILYESGFDHVELVSGKSRKPIERGWSTSNGEKISITNQFGTIRTNSEEYVPQSETDEIIIAIAEFACNKTFATLYRYLTKTILFIKHFVSIVHFIKKNHQLLKCI